MTKMSLTNLFLLHKSQSKYMTRNDVEKSKWKRTKDTQKSKTGRRYMSELK